MNKETQSAAAVVIDGVMHDMREDFEYKITYPETRDYHFPDDWEMVEDFKYSLTYSKNMRHSIRMKPLPVAIKAIYGRGHTEIVEAP